MRARVESTWRTRLLFLAAFVLAGVIAWSRVQTRIAEERQAAEAAERAPAEDDVIDVEIIVD